MKAGAGFDLSAGAYDEFAGDNEAAVFRFAEHKIAIGKVAAALRPELVQSGLSNHPLNGCDTTQLVHSNSHLIIQVQPNGDDAEATKLAASAITQVIGDLAEDGNVLGVLWTHSNSLYSIDDLSEAITCLDQSIWPSKFWVGVRPTKTQKGAEVRTLGADTFLGHEYVMRGSPDQGLRLYQTVLALLNYMFETGAVIEAGSDVKFPDDSTLDASASINGSIELSVRE